MPLSDKKTKPLCCYSGFGEQLHDQVCTYISSHPESIYRFRVAAYVCTNSIMYIVILETLNNSTAVWFSYQIAIGVFTNIRALSEY